MSYMVLDGERWGWPNDTGLGSERIVRYEYQFFADVGVLQALPAWVAGLRVGNVGNAASGPKQVSVFGCDRCQLEGCGGDHGPYFWAGSGLVAGRIRTWIWPLDRGR